MLTPESLTVRKPYFFIISDGSLKSSSATLGSHVLPQMLPQQLTVTGIGHGRYLALGIPGRRVRSSAEVAALYSMQTPGRSLTECSNLLNRFQVLKRLAQR